jgi:hypothetical protein
MLVCCFHLPFATSVHGQSRARARSSNGRLAERGSIAPSNFEIEPFRIFTTTQA